MRIFLISFAALAAAAAAFPAGTIQADWLLLGAQLGIDSINRPIIMASGFAWLLAALVLQRSTPGAAFATVGVTLGNAIVLIALDHATLFTGFAVMSLSAYGFFAPFADRSRRIAARTYISYAIAAEVLLFTAMLSLTAGNPSMLPSWAALLVIFGFGIKAGLVPLHGPLPLTYRHVSTAAAILLGGGALNAAVLGWLRWLGGVELTQPAAIGELLVWLGGLGYVFAVGLGFTQGHPRAILGYSSASQVALITIVLGAALATGPLDNQAAANIALMALFHGIAKTVLFAASAGYPTRTAARVLWWAGVAAAGASLGGLALSAGYLAKQMLVSAAEGMLGPVTGMLAFTGPISVALLTWFALTVRKTTPRNHAATGSAGLLGAVAGVTALTVWAAGQAQVPPAEWLLSALFLLAGASAVIPLRRWAGRDRAVCGDVAVLAGDTLFRNIIRGRTLAADAAAGLKLKLMS